MSSDEAAAPWPASWRAGSGSARCPLCGAKEGRPIMWGMPGPEVFEALESGEIDVVLGGCRVGSDTHQCKICGTSFAAWSRLR